MAQPKLKRVKVKLLKGVRINGKHVDEGKRIEVDAALAHDMIASNQAVRDEDDDDRSEGLENDEMGVQMANPTHGDPGHTELPARSKARIIENAKKDATK